jgi:hypothetical protein
MADNYPKRYQNDQFYNFSNYESGVKPGYGPAIGSRDNPQFIWPSDVNKNAITGEKFKLQRGYMRMLAESYGTDTAMQNLAKRRFHFQFNPDVLVRSVSARNDVQFWMNQDPSQFVNPIPGDSNFAFTFILNREAEVASGTYRENSTVKKNTKPANMPGTLVDVYEPVVGTPPGRDRSQKVGTTTGEYDPASVTDIGVLADLMVFDQIIGQGLNQDLATKMLGKIDDYAKAYNSTLTGASAGTQDGQDQQGIVLHSDLSGILSGSIGNSAFLIAQPVRVVFSSLYMVEGFITSTTVTFNKFNLSMVPTQCTVEVNMQAMYIGFATRDTFLTRTLKASVEAGNDSGSQSPDKEEVLALQPLANDLINRVVRSESSVASTLNPFSNDSERKELKVSDVLGKGDTTHFEVSIVPTNRYDVNKDYISQVDATLILKIYYKGRDAGGPDGDYAIGDLVYETSAQSRVTFDSLVPLFNARPTSFEITKKNPVADQKWDSAINARYLIEATISFIATGTQGGQATSKQFASARTTIRFGEWMDGNSFSMKTLESQKKDR